MYLKTNISYLRKHSGLSYRALASACNVSVTALRQIEEGLCINPGIVTIDKLATYFQLSIDDLMKKNLGTSK